MSCQVWGANMPESEKLNPWDKDYRKSFVFFSRMGNVHGSHERLMEKAPMPSELKAAHDWACQIEQCDVFLVNLHRNNIIEYFDKVRPDLNPNKYDYKSYEIVNDSSRTSWRAQHALQEVQQFRRRRQVTRHRPSPFLVRFRAAQAAL